MISCTKCRFFVHSPEYRGNIVRDGGKCPWCGGRLELSIQESFSEIDMYHSFPVPSTPFWRPGIVDNPLVSVIIRTYQEPSEWVYEAIESALGQDIEVEVIVVEDGRSDFIVPYQDPRCGWYRLPSRQGMAVARNVGLQHARGRYVRMLDGDDRLPAGALRRQVEELETHPESRICFGLLLPFGDHERVGDKWYQNECLYDAGWDGSASHLREILLSSRWTMVPGPTALWLRTWGPVEVPTDCVTGEDAAFYRLAIGSDPSLETCRMLPEVVLDYRLHDNQSTHQGIAEMYKLRRQALEVRLDEGVRLGRLASYRGSPRQIVDIETALYIGGAQWQLAQLACHMDRRRVVMRFLCQQSTPMSEWLQQQGVMVELKPEGVDLESWAAQYIQENGIDIVGTSWAAKLITDKIRDAAPCCIAHVQSTEISCAGLRPDNKELLERFDRFVCVSDSVQRASPWLGSNTIVIPNGVNGHAIRQAHVLRDTMRKALGVPADRYLVIWSGRLHSPGKRTDLLRELIDRFKHEAYFLVLGNLWEGNSSYDMYKTDWEQWIVDRPVIWRHHINPWEVPALMVAGDVYLSTSDVEGFSLSLLEGAAAECYPVITDTAGSSEIVSHGLTGLISPVGDLEGLSHNLERCLGMSEDERQYAARQLGHLTIARYDIRACARRHEEFYLSC